MVGSEYSPGSNKNPKVLICVPDHLRFKNMCKNVARKLKFVIR